MERDREGKEEEKIMRVIYKNELFSNLQGDNARSCATALLQQCVFALTLIGGKSSVA